MSICITPCAVLTLVLIVLAAVGSLGPRKRHQNGSVVLNLMVDESVPVGVVDENFVCATIDWWPQEQCSYGSCTWNHSSILNLDLTNSLLQKAVTALSPLLIRLGGSLQDQVIYNVGNSLSPCKPFTTSPKTITRFEFSTGCLNMSRWDELNDFFHTTESLVTFGLNSLYGRKHTGTTYEGAWNSSNARELISYTSEKGYPIKAWELGNEINGWVGVTLDPTQFAADVRQLKRVIDDIYPSETQRPLVVAPDGFFDSSWYHQLLKQTNEKNVLDAVSFHVYNLGPGNGIDIAAKILSSGNNSIYGRVQDVVKRSGSRARPWVGEAGGIYNSGQHLVSDTFIFSFWYLDQLGQAALHNVAVFCRQSLIGGNYGLLDANFNPNPDFYAALLWKKLMGETVLNAASLSSLTPSLHTYAHCLKDSRGGVAILFINFSEATEYLLDLPFASNSRKLEYHLTTSTQSSNAKLSIQSSKINLNGRTLETSADGNMPDLTPITVAGKEGTRIAPLSIAFVAVPDILAPACTL